MKKSLRSLCAVTTISLCAMGNLFAVDNNYPKIRKQSQWQSQLQ